MYEQLPNRSILCLDMRSFYASCSAAIEGVDVMDTPIAIIGNKERKGGVVLAASPPLKQQFGIRTGMRLYEIPDDPAIQLIEPKMQFYIDVSMAITRLLHRYVPKEAIHAYSIDESFIDLTGTERLWGPPAETAARIRDDLYTQFQLRSACGMGPNMLLSKLALDLEAKKTGIAHWRYEDVPEKLWPVAPLSRMWGIGSRMEKRLNRMGLFSIGDLARTPLDHLEKKFGIMGNQLYYHAHGIDLSDLGLPPLIEGQVSYGKGQVLYRDYVKRADILTVLLEMCEDVAMRARQAGRMGRTLHLAVSYSKHALGEDSAGRARWRKRRMIRWSSTGFARNCSMSSMTDARCANCISASAIWKRSIPCSLACLTSRSGETGNLAKRWTRSALNTGPTPCSAPPPTPKRGQQLNAPN